ncbi:hypothetical protein EWB00_010825 [Schistosoma japonicum]|uniref:Uncharacterized protein n=1 Tax=Schistosoma japonicum TaxID=6182 RepID=A0A4Z2DMH2_SCHJA|nr:hypothetical protein EWB00_010825 [Schistosoma japonicum]
MQPLTNQPGFAFPLTRRCQLGQYTSMISERAHEEGVFGHSSVPLPRILGTEPAEGNARLFSSVDS